MEVVTNAKTPPPNIMIMRMKNKVSIIFIFFVELKASRDSNIKAARERKKERSCRKTTPGASESGADYATAGCVKQNSPIRFAWNSSATIYFLPFLLHTSLVTLKGGSKVRKK